MMNHKRLLSLVLAVVMVLSLTSPAIAVEHDHGVAFTQVSDDRITETLNGRQEANIPDPEPAHEEDEVLRVSIFLEKKGTIDAGFSPLGIADSSAALAYNQSLKQEQETMTQKISKAIGQELDVVWNLTLATNLISANVRYGQIAAIEALPGVEKVVVENIYYPTEVEQGEATPNMSTSGNQTGAFNAWNLGYTGAGSRIAIIDSGLDVEHEAFDATAYLHSLELQAEKNGMEFEEYLESLDLLDAGEINKVLTNLNAYGQAYSNGWVAGADLFVNDKVAYGYNYVDINLDLTHYDSEHGSHVAGIAAANTYIPSGNGYADAMATTGVQGVAPDAQLLVMKVFGEYGGAYDSDYMAAIEDAVLLGADAVNLSLGSAAPGMTAIDSYNADEYNQIMENLVNSGVVVAISAGNNSHWAEPAENGNGLLYADDVSFHTGGSPGTYTNSLCVASADNAGKVLMLGGSSVTYAESVGYGNASISTLDGTYEYIYVNSLGTAHDFQTLGRERLEGKIVLCNRGDLSFTEKANNAAAMGAAAVIIVNNEYGQQYMDLTGYQYDVPVVCVSLSYSDMFKNNGHGWTYSDIVYWTGTVELAPEPWYMSSFSSWGVPGSLEMKPEITAPGGEIYNVAGDVSNPYYEFVGHNNYEYMSGTSMAAPQVAGMSAVLAQFIRETGLDTKTGVAVRTLAQSLLMSTAEPMMDPTNTTYNCYYPVLQQGAGMGNVSNAIQADSYILMGADATASWADGKVKVELGDDPDKTGVYSFSFTIYNLTDMDKVFTLSADFFTQALYNYNNNMMLATWTRPLAPETTWTVDGETVENGAALAGMDFDGNGAVNHADGQALLDYAAGIRAQLTNMDKADLDGDGIVDTYDAYLFYDKLEDNGALVPGNGSVTVTATVTLTQADREVLADYPVGAYLQGFVYAESLAAEEGMAGTSHSIPVLGFYGNWSDASMYDKGSFVEYWHGTETRLPYLYYSNYVNGFYNGLVYYDAGDGGEYWFGGNPVIQDETYMPERNAFNPDSGDEITEVAFVPIRNAGGVWSFVRDAGTGEYLETWRQRYGNYSAFYNSNNGYWEFTNDFLDPFVELWRYDNNARLEVGILSAPEYYVDEMGEVDFNALGKGAEFSMPLTIDTENPKVHTVSVDTENDLLNIRVSDNQYIAAVVLYDSTGSSPLTYAGSQAQAQAGDTLDYALDISAVNGAGFLLVAYDYAGNGTVYELDMQIGEIVDDVDAVVVTPETLALQVGGTAQLTAQVLPTNSSNRGISWHSEDPDVVTVDQNGNVLAVGVGATTVHAVSTYDQNIYGSCYVEVVDFNTELNAILWDEYSQILYTEFNVNDPSDWTALSGDLYSKTYGIMTSACVGSDGTLYVGTLNTGYGDGCLYAMDPDTFAVSYLSDCVIQGYNIFYADMTYAPAMFGTGVILAAYGANVIAVDPDTGEAMGVVDQFDSDILGITTVNSYYYYADGAYIYEDAVLLTFADGTVIEVCYYGYDGYLWKVSGISMTTGIDVGNAWYYNSAYYDGNYLYWAAFDIDNDYDVTLYAIDYYGSGNVYEMGQFGYNIWPVGGLHEKGVAPQISYTSSARMEEQPDLQSLETQEIELQPISDEYLTKLRSAMSGSGSTSAPQSTIGQDEDRVVVDITAEVDSHNGLVTITYDPEEMILEDVIVNAQHSAVRDLDGTVTIAYVELAGIAADEVIATLKFQMIDDTAQATVIHHEVNDQNPGWQEILTVGCFHTNMTHTPAQTPGCTDPGNVEYWFCSDCGKYFLDVAGQVEAEQEDLLLEATGHTWGDWETVTPPTEENPGTKKRTCTKCGEEEEEPIPPTGVLHGDTNDDDTIDVRDVILLRQYLAGWTVTIDMLNADVNGDTLVDVRDVILLRQYLAGWNVTLGPDEPEDTSWILGEWVNITRTDRYEEARGAWVGKVDENYYIFNEDGTGETGSYEWTSWDLNNGVPGDTWMLEGMGFFSYDFTYTLEGDRLTINLEYYDDTGDEPDLITETKVYIVTRNADGSVTRTLEGSGYDTVYRQVEEDTTMEEKLELFGLDPDVPDQYETPEVPVVPEWLLGEWTRVSRTEEVWGEYTVAYVDAVRYTFNADGTGVSSHERWVSWDVTNGGPGNHWETTSDDGTRSFTYTLEGDQLTLNVEEYNPDEEDPEVYISTKVYTVARNQDGSITWTWVEWDETEVYRQVEGDLTVEELLELFGLDPNVPGQYETPEVPLVP